MDSYRPPSLDLEHAYEAVYQWVSHAHGKPDAVSEPVDGVVELVSPELVARIRWSRIALTQGAILALLRSIDETLPDGDRRPLAALFSVTGYTPGALAVGETQGVALFEIDEFGEVIPMSPAAYAIIPAESPPPLFAPSAPDVDPAPKITIQRSDPADWTDCPRCGATHHRKANFCASCGADFNEPVEHQGTAVPSPATGGPTLRCRTCGSDDIELIRPG